MEKQELQNALMPQLEGAWWRDIKYLKKSEDGKSHYLDVPEILQDHYKMVRQSVLEEISDKAHAINNAVQDLLEDL